VLILVLESTRASSLALYDPAASGGRDLLRWRDEAVVFEHVYAPVPTSAHALFSIFYGVYPYLGPFWTSSGKAVVADSMAQFFTRTGYVTQLYVTADLNYDNVRSFAARGFQTVLDTNDWPGQDAYAKLPWGRDDRLLIEQIKEFITTAGQRPFFLVGMTSNPHHPYAVDHLPAAPQAEDDNGRAAYERLVDYDVRLVTELYEWMKRRGIAQTTLLLVLGDHGEAFGEHAGDFGHAAFIYDENVHIPCFILHPRRWGLPRRIAQLGSQVDLRATIMDMMRLHDTEPSDGVSLLGTTPDRQVINFTENGVSHFGVRDTSYSYIYTPHVGNEQVFDRRTDPRETHNIAGLDPVTTARYRARLQRWETEHQLSLARVLR
jgi:arylsulfatase A-like enzyme